MPTHRSRGVVTVTATLALLLVVTGGCGRRGLPAGAGVDGANPSGVAGSPTAGAPVEPSEPAPPPTAAETQAPETTARPAATPPPNQGAQPTPAPLATPDLSAIERLLADLDAALGADATADTEEGSAP